MSEPEIGGLLFDGLRIHSRVLHLLLGRPVIVDGALGAVGGAAAESAHRELQRAAAESAEWVEGRHRL